MTEALLSGLRVLDLADPDSAFAGKILAELGAEVTLVEPPDGVPLRRLGPFLDGTPGRERGLAFWHYRGAATTETLDPADVAAPARLRDLLSATDLLLDRGPVGGLAAFGIDPAGLSREFPRLVTVSLSPFGRTGPRTGWLGDDFIAWAAGGTMSLLGSADREPLDAPWQATHFAGFWAAIGGLAATLARDRLGHGQLVDLSLQEAVATHAAGAVIFTTYAGQRLIRRGGDSGLVCPSVVAPCRDGFIQVVTVVRRQWQTLVRWLQEDGAAAGFDAPEYVDVVRRVAEKDRLHAAIGRWTAGFAKQDLFREAQARGLAFGVVQSRVELGDDPQLAARGYYQESQQPLREQSVRVPGPPYRVLAAAATSTPANRPIPGPPPGVQQAPLAGVRVLDFTWVLAGPFATRILADLGADVIKVEARGAGDGARWNPPFKDGERGIDRSGLFNDLNHNKRSLTVDLKHPEGQALVERLALEWADVLVENFGAGTLERLDLDPRGLIARQPRLIVGRLAGFGQAGPYRDYLGYAPAIHALAGLTSSIRYPEGPPRGVAIPLGDYAGGLYGALTTIAALLARQRTGAGCLVDLSQFEAAVGLNGPDLIAAWLTGLDPEPRHNTFDAVTGRARWIVECHPGVWRSDAAAEPVGIPRWVAVAPATPAAWIALARLLGQPECVGPEPVGMGAIGGIGGAVNELRSALDQWVAERDADEAAAGLQAAGVPAYPIREGWELARTDSQMAARGFYVPVDHPTCGEVTASRLPPVFGVTPATIRRPAPLLGEHTDEILRVVLGFSEEQATDLVLRHVV